MADAERDFDRVEGLAPSGGQAGFSFDVFDQVEGLADESERLRAIAHDERTAAHRARLHSVEAELSRIADLVAHHARRRQAD